MRRIAQIDTFAHCPHLYAKIRPCQSAYVAIAHGEFQHQRDNQPVPYIPSLSQRFIPGPNTQQRFPSWAHIADILPATSRQIERRHMPTTVSIIGPSPMCRQRLEMDKVSACTHRIDSMVNGPNEKVLHVPSRQTCNGPVQIILCPLHPIRRQNPENAFNPQNDIGDGLLAWPIPFHAFQHCYFTIKSEYFAKCRHISLHFIFLSHVPLLYQTPPSPLKHIL